MINKNDIIKLDEIVKTILLFDYAITQHEFKNDIFPIIEKEKDRELEFERLFSIISNYGYAKFNKSDNWYSTIERNSETRNFNESGGFAKVYQDELTRLKKVEQKDKLELDLAKSNLEANELNRSIAAKNERNERKNTVVMWVNISIGVLNIVLIAIQIWLSLQKP